MTYLHLFHSELGQLDFLLNQEAIEVKQRILKVLKKKKDYAVLYIVDENGNVDQLLLPGKIIRECIIVSCKNRHENTEIDKEDKGKKVLNFEKYLEKKNESKKVDFS